MMLHQEYKERDDRFRFRLYEVNSTHKGEATSKDAQPSQVKASEVATNHRQGSYPPMEAQCCELWGHPITCNPQRRYHFGQME